MTEEVVTSETNGEEKTEDSGVQDSELENAIIRQVEYYFGDMNIVRDKFLREQVKLDDGWVPLDVLVRFNRLAKLSTDLDVIANALGKSTSGLIEVSEDNKKIRRNPEMPVPEMNEDRRKELLARTIYAKGFPKDSVLDDILKFFKEQGDIENVIMRRYLDKQSKKRQFKGSVFATFKTKEQAEKLLETKDLKYGEAVLQLLWQEVYLQKKQEEYAETKAKREKKTKGEGDGNVKQEVKEEFKLPPGSVFRFTEAKDTFTRENIKDALTAIGADVAYIEFKVGDKEGWVRLAKENQAKEVFEKFTDGKLKIEDTEVVFSMLGEEEEKTYLENSVKEMQKRRKNQKSFGKNRNFKGKQQRKRKQENHDEAPATKVKTES